MPLHEGREEARDPLALMRARYSAYVKRLPQFLVSTTHRENPDNQSGTLLKETEAIVKFVTFEKLTLVATENRDDEVRVGNPPARAALTVLDSGIWDGPRASERW